MHETRGGRNSSDSSGEMVSRSARNLSTPVESTAGNGPAPIGPPAHSRRRLLFLGISGLAIAAICLFKVTRTYDPPPPDLEEGEYKRQAPLLSQGSREHRLIDSRNRLFRLETYLGRHPVLLVFFDGKKGANADPLLGRLREDAKRLEKRRFKIVAVSSALPQENRRDFEEHGPFPFPVLTDLEPEYRLHQLWGCVEPGVEPIQPRTGFFYIDLGSRVAWENNAPRAIADPGGFLDRLLATE